MTERRPKRSDWKGPRRQFALRMAHEEFEFVEAAATAQKTTVTEFIVGAAVRSARRVLGGRN